MEQLKFAYNGLIQPCPYRENCGAYHLEDGIAEDGTRFTRGCDGKTFFCNSPRKEGHDDTG